MGRVGLAALLVLGVARANAQERTTLTVLFTSDMHANVLPYNYLRQKPSKGSIAQVATLVARVRAESPRTVVLDGGDAIEGTPLAHYAHVGPGSGGDDPTITAMNFVGYDASVLGNHEFNYGLGVLCKSVAQSRFPWLAANLEGAAAVGLSVKSDLVIERGGVRIGIVGLTNPNVPHWDPPSHWRGLTFLDPIATAQARLATLRQRADVVIVVVHAGFERDLVSGVANDSDQENFAWRLAQLPGIDLLLTGHTHRDIPPQRLGSTWIVQPGRWAELVTRFDLTLEKTPTGWRVIETHGANLPTVGETPSAAVTAAVQNAHARTEQELSRQIGQLVTPLVLHGAPTNDDAAIDLIHAAQLEASGAELSLAAPLGPARVEFPAGPLTGRLAHALYPYPNTLVVVRVTGTQLKDILEHAVRGWIGLDCTGVSGCVLQREQTTPAYNYDTVAGATYLVDVTRPLGDRVRGLRVAGQPVTSERSFTLVINSYRAAGGGGYPHLTTLPRVKEVDRPMVEILLEYFQRHSRISPTADDNWAYVVPLREALAPPVAPSP